MGLKARRGRSQGSQVEEASLGEGAEGQSPGEKAGLPRPSSVGSDLTNIFINDPERGSKQSVNEICRGY